MVSIIEYTPRLGRAVRDNLDLLGHKVGAWLSGGRQWAAERVHSHSRLQPSVCLLDEAPLLFTKWWCVCIVPVITLQSICTCPCQATLRPTGCSSVRYCIHSCTPAWAIVPINEGSLCFLICIACYGRQWSQFWCYANEIILTRVCMCRGVRFGGTLEKNVVTFCGNVSIVAIVTLAYATLTLWLETLPHSFKGEAVVQ